MPTSLLKTKKIVKASDARCYWTDAGDEEQSTWQESPGGARDAVANPSPVKLNSLPASWAFWSPHHQRTICAFVWAHVLGRWEEVVAVWPLLLSISIPQPPFRRVSLTAATGANKHWPLPGVKDTVLLSLAWCQLSRAPLSKISWVASSKGVKGTSSGGRSGSTTAKELPSFLGRTDSNSYQLLLPREKTAREFSSVIIILKDLLIMWHMTQWKPTKGFF